MPVLQEAARRPMARRADQIQAEKGIRLTADNQDHKNHHAAFISFDRIRPIREMTALDPFISYVSAFAIHLAWPAHMHIIKQKPDRCWEGRQS